MSGTCVAACPSFDRPPSLPRLRHRCHSALFEVSSVLCSRPTPHAFRPGFAPSSFPDWPGTAGRGCGRHEASQVPHKGRLHVHGVSDCARSIPHSPTNAWDDVAFSSAERDRHLGKASFAAQYPAHGLPCERFAAGLATRTSRITRGRSGWLGLTPQWTFTSYPLPACPGALRLWLQAEVRAMSPVRPLIPQQATFAGRCPLSCRFRPLYP